MTLAEKFAEKYNEINHRITTGRQIDYPEDIKDGSSFFGPIEKTGPAPVYQFDDGSKTWWSVGDLWRTNSDGSGPKVNPLRPTKPGCRCDLGLRCNGLAIYDDLVLVKSQRRRAQRDLNDKVEELFQARAKILKLAAELTELKDEKKNWVSCEVGQALVTRQWADQRVEECKDSLNYRIDELEKENKLIHHALNVANDTNVTQLNTLVDYKDDVVQRESTIKAYTKQIGQLQDQLTMAKSAASPTKGVLESLELIEGVECAWLMKEASGHIVIGLAINPSQYDDIQAFLNSHWKDIFPVDTNTEVKIFIELTYGN